MKAKRLWYAAVFTVLLITEVLIALYVKDAFIRPYGGDILVTILLCCLVRIIVPDRWRLLPLWIFLLATAVEAAQYFDFVTRIGLGDIAFFRILLGTSFAWLDILCYALGCVIFWGSETVLRFGTAHRK